MADETKKAEMATCPRCEYYGESCPGGAHVYAQYEDGIRSVEDYIRKCAPASASRTQPEQAEEVDFGVEPYSPEDAVAGACGLLDVIKSEWGDAWSEHDQKVRAGLSRIISREMLKPTRPEQLPERPTREKRLEDALRMMVDRHELNSFKFEAKYGDEFDTLGAVLIHARAALESHE